MKEYNLLLLARQHPDATGRELLNMLDELTKPEKKVIGMIISLDITTNKDIETIRSALKRGIYMGLDSPTYGVASPSGIKINYCQER